MQRFIPTMGVALLFTAALLLGAGCGGTRAPKPTEQGKNTGHGHEHEHGEEGPHGGALASWGEDHKYHAEFTVDHDKKQATVYILDGSAKKAAPIAAESITLTITNLKPAVQVNLKATPDKDDPEGKSSRFVGTHDDLAKKMEFKGEISGKVDNTPYVGKFEEHAHDHDHPKKSGS